MAIAEIKWKLVKDTYFFDTTTCYLSENGNHMFYSGGEKRIKILIDDLNELVRKGCAMWLKLGEYDFALDKLSKCPITTWYSINQKLYSLESWGVIKESKKSARKSIKESENFVNYIAVYDEDSNCRGYIQNESPRLTQDVEKALHFKNENEANAFRAKLIKHGSFNGDELYIEGIYLNESKELARKSIKESKTNYLTVEEFCNLCAKIFIHYEIWSFDGNNRYEESYDLSKIKYSPYKNHDVLMWDFDKDVLILYIENNAIPF